MQASCIWFLWDWQHCNLTFSPMQASCISTSLRQQRWRKHLPSFKPTVSLRIETQRVLDTKSSLPKFVSKLQEAVLSSLHIFSRSMSCSTPWNYSNLHASTHPTRFKLGWWLRIKTNLFLFCWPCPEFECLLPWVSACSIKRAHPNSSYQACKLIEPKTSLVYHCVWASPISKCNCRCTELSWTWTLLWNFYVFLCAYMLYRRGLVST